MVDYNGCTRSGCTASQTIDVLCEVVVGATLSTATPVSSTERHDSCATTTAMVMSSHAVSMVTTHVWRAHHVRRPIPSEAAVATVRVTTCASGREGTPEASSPSLEV